MFVVILSQQVQRVHVRTLVQLHENVIYIHGLRDEIEKKNVLIFECIVEFNANVFFKAQFYLGHVCIAHSTAHFIYFLLCSELKAAVTLIIHSVVFLFRGYI